MAGAAGPPAKAALDSDAGHAAGPATAVDAGPCADERRIADERCEVAVRARARSDAAADAVRAAQRIYDGHESAAAAATEIADPRAIQAAKEEAQADVPRGRLRRDDTRGARGCGPGLAQRGQSDQPLGP